MLFPAPSAPGQIPGLRPTSADSTRRRGPPGSGCCLPGDSSLSGIYPPVRTRAMQTATLRRPGTTTAGQFVWSRVLLDPGRPTFLIVLLSFPPHVNFSLRTARNCEDSAPAMIGFPFLVFLRYPDWRW